MSVIPGFIHRTVAGVPEKEPGGIFFMFLSLYLIACAFKEEKLKKSALLGLLAGISTALMGLLWGGVTFLYVAIAFATLLIFFFSNLTKKDVLAYALWVVGFTAILVWFPRYGLGLFTSSTSGIAYFVLILLITDLILFNTKLNEKLRLNRIKAPRKIISFIVLVAAASILLLIADPGFISHTAGDVSNYIFKPFAMDRLTVTVAENSKPFFDSWIWTGPAWLGLAFFWIFILGSVLLVHDLLEKLKLKERMLISGLYLLLIIGMIFSEYSSSKNWLNIFNMNGTSFISMLFFLGSIALFFLVLAVVYSREKELNLDKDLLLVFAVFFFAIFSARSAIRLFYFIYPIAPIIAAFFIVRISEMALTIKGDVEKIIVIIFALLVILASVSAFYQFEKAAESEVRYQTVPGHYQIQWQNAMSWVRENTPKDAVFAHWWDYGYWVQTMGERATVLDGGNSIAYWDYLMGRHVLTAANETEALEFLKTHKATYLLIDSTDIGKYTAYSSIGSDKNYDRYSWISTFSLSDTQEKRNETTYIFTGGTWLDDDLIWKGQIYPAKEAGIGAIVVPIKTGAIENYSVGTLGQPSVIISYQNKQTSIPLKCIYIEGKKIEFDVDGIDGCFYTVPSISENKLSKMGAGLWLSNKLMNSLMVKLYILNETENFELVHSENDPIINEINSKYSLNLPGLLIYSNAGLIGPLNIWKINYPNNIQENPDYLALQYPEKELWEVKA
jgi:asparagine N-glycosylation enzyme membrane subunit Stt3